MGLDVTHAHPVPVGLGVLELGAGVVGLGVGLVGVSVGLVVLELVVLGLVVLEPGDALSTGLGDGAVPDCPAQWTRADVAGHFGTAASDTRVSFPDARQA